MKLLPLLTLLAATIVSPSAAQAFSITPTTNPALLRDTLLGNSTGLSNFTVETIGDARAFGLLTDDPFSLTRSLALSTGKVSDLQGANTRDGRTIDDQDLSADFGVGGTSGDSISFALSFDADSTAEKLFFQYVFGSEEFVEYGGKFNDSFSLNLNGLNYAKLSDGKRVTINNLVPAPNGPYHPDFINNPVGIGPVSSVTRLDGFTRPLLFEAPLKKNARNTLVVNVQDALDGVLDTAVFIKGGTLGTVRPPDISNGGNSAAAPEPTTIVGLAMAGAGLVAARRKAKSRR